MKMTKFQKEDRTKGECGTMWVKETNPYYSYYRQTFKVLGEKEVGA
jgi:hypothetical protein